MKVRTLDRLSLWGIAASIGVMVQPVWPAGFRVGFFCALVFTVLQIVTAHLVEDDA